MNHSARAVAFVVHLALIVTAPAVAFDWPEITDAEKALTEAPGHPNAPAVVLRHIGRIHLDEDNRSSYVDSYTRIKILNDEGTEYGTVAIGSTEFMRTKQIEGRTHLPDGRVVELPDNAKFEKEYSDYYDMSVTSCALPEVVPGSIVEYHYRSYFDSVFYPRVWYFQSELPTLLSTVTFELPRTIAFYPVEVDTLKHVELQRETEVNARGGILTYTMENLPPVPDEPFRFPFVDLSARVVVLPGIDNSHSPPLHLFDSWDSLLSIVFGRPSWGYVAFRRDARKAKKIAKSIAASHSDSAARSIYDWVRDEIALEPFVGVIAMERTANEIIENQRGDVAELGLLLETMLDAAGFEAHLVWANPRDNGRVMQHVPNPRQFDRMLVVVELDGERVFLDPTDSSLGFGILPPDLQGVPVLIVKSRRKFEWVETPRLTAEESTRHATIELMVDNNGVMSGLGSIDLRGNHAWRRTQWRDTAQEAVEGWTEWIEDRFPGFDIADVEVAERAETTAVAVSWTMQQRADEVLGDEATIRASAPLGLTRNPFTLTPRQRITPVQLSFPDTDIVDMTLTWPEGWALDGLPGEVEIDTGAGSYTSDLTIDREARTLRFNRSMSVTEIEFLGGRAYAALWELYREAVKRDTQELVLIAE